MFRGDVKLNIGCGDRILDGFVNIDSRNLNGVDLVCDIRDVSRFPPESIDLIYCSHVLEHVSRREYKLVLSNWHKSLRSGGKLRLAVPDMEAVFDHYAKHKNLEVLRGFLWGGQNYKENFHCCGWDFQSLKSDLEEAGFSQVRKYDWRETEHSNVDDFSQSYLPHMNKENGMLMSLNVEAVK